METLINEFGGFPLWKKGLILVGAPLFILLICLRGLSAISFMFDSAARNKTDQKSSELDAKIEATASEVIKDQGVVNQLEADKSESENAQKNVDSVAFYNDRFKPKQ